MGGVSKRGETAGDENLGVYDFKDNKTAGTVTVTKVWDDDKTNEERVIPDIKISTEKPSKSALGYMVTFHGDKDAGLVFDDGRDVNEVVYNSSGQIVDGMFKVPGGWAAGAVSWFTDKKLKNKVNVSEDGTVQMSLSGDIDLWGKVKTFEIKGAKYNVKNDNEFNASIPDTVTEIFFTDEIKPADAEIIDVDADGDGGVVAWTENKGVVMKVSTQIKGIKVQAAKDSRYMFDNRSKLTNIDFSMLDTKNVTYMNSMFGYCSGLTTLDLSTLNTQNVTDMSTMFYNCSGLTSLDLSPLDTQKVTDMSSMFERCSSLTALDLSQLDTQKVTYMSSMFERCSSLTALDLSQLDTENVTSMGSMFKNCGSLTALDLSPLDTQNVTYMSCMFQDCIRLTALDLSPLNTQNVTNMSSMFYDCRSLTALDLSTLNTQNVTNMSSMFYDCIGLTALDLSTLDTHNVTNMSSMFYNCIGLTTLDLSQFNTQNVTSMSYMFFFCSDLTTLTTGPNFKFVGTNYSLKGTWQNTAGETFTSGSFPSNVADTYTKISD